MSSPPVHHIDVRAFRYATEVPDRVDAALQAVYPRLGEDEEPTIERTVTEGHYGHRIDIYEFHLDENRAIETLFERIRDHGELSRLIEELPDRINDETELFVRFDKQAAYTDEELIFGPGIELRAKVEAYPAKREAAIKNLTEYLTALDEGQ